MIRRSDFKAFFALHGSWIAAICSMLVVILARVEFTSHFITSLVGMHYRVESSSRYGSKDMIYHIDFSQRLMPSDEDVPVLYKIGVKDILTILALHLPIHVFFFFVWDNARNDHPLPGATRETIDRFCFYFTSELMFCSCSMLDVVISFKEGYSNAFPLSWDGPQGHMTFLVKLCFLVQFAVLCYFMERLYFSGQSITLMRDCWIIGILSLVSIAICYVLNFVPLMVTVGIQHFGHLTSECSLKALSQGELPEGFKNVARVWFRVEQWSTGFRALIYLDVIKDSLKYMCRVKSSILEQVFILVPLSALVVQAVLRFRDNRSFDLVRSREGARAS